MADQLIPAKDILLFDVDQMVSEEYFIIVRPQGYNINLVFSPYFIKRLVKYAKKQRILVEHND